MMPLTRVLIDTPERRTKWRYPRTSDWVGGICIAALIVAACLIT